MCKYAEVRVCARVCVCLRHAHTHTLTRMYACACVRACVRVWLADTVVVAVSLLSLSMSEGNGGIKSIRLVRVARALRLVARFQSLRKIVDALTQAIFPVLSACMVAIMAMSIFAILGVSFFGQIAPTYFGDFGALVVCLCVEVCLVCAFACAIVEFLFLSACPHVHTYDKQDSR
jgi:hypothetical protein